MITSDEEGEEKKKDKNKNAPKPQDAYVAAEEKLIEKLEELANPAAIKDAADITIRLLKNTVDHLITQKTKAA
jgi:hypothetical protein